MNAPRHARDQQPSAPLNVNTSSRSAVDNDGVDSSSPDRTQCSLVPASSGPQFLQGSGALRPWHHPPSQGTPPGTACVARMRRVRPREPPFVTAPLRGRRGRGAPGCCRRDPQRRRTAHDQRWRGGDLVADGEWRVGAAHRRRSKSPCPADSSSQTRRTVSITWIGKQHAPLTWSVSDQPGSPAISVTSPGSSAVEAATRRGAGWCRRGRRRSSGWAAGTAGPA